MRTKTMKLWQILAAMSAALLVFACEDPLPVEPDQPGQTEQPENPGEDPGNTEDPSDEKPTAYKISLKAESEFYEVEFPETAEPGEVVTVTVTPVENVFIDAVRYNSAKADKVEGEDNTFEFEMPKKNVVLSVNSSSTVTVLPSSYFTGNADAEIAAAGDIVTVTFYVNNIEDAVGSAIVNNTIECTYLGADLGEYVYEFEMPEGPAVVEGFTAVEYHVIEREWDEHCVISMLDCINHQGTPEEFCSQKVDGIVHFIYKWDLGYDVTCTVTGLTTGKDYTGDIFWSPAADSHLYQDSWAFYMPKEPVLIKAVSTEKTTYAGAEFVGSYKGYWVTLGDNKIYSSSQPTMNMELRQNTAYFVTSTDANAYDFAGLYTENNGQIAADREAEKEAKKEGDYALRGQILENGYAFAIIDYLLVDNVDNRRFYFNGKNDFSFVCAADYSDNRYLLEANEGGQKTWYFVERDNQSIKKATLTFVNGSSIGETCEAIVTVEGGIAFNQTEVFKYTHANGSAPVFTYTGKEAGTYTSAKGETLVLDGLGNANYNGTEGTYTIESGVVTFTDKEGKQTKMTTDANAKTFTVVIEASEETLKALAAEYKTTTAKISINGVESETGTIYVGFDRNYYDNYYKGYAKIQITYVSKGSKYEIVGDTKKYVVDEVARTVTFPKVIQGDGINNNKTISKDIVFKISDDFKTLTLVNEFVYSSVTTEFCYGGAVLDAVVE